MNAFLTNTIVKLLGIIAGYIFVIIAGYIAKKHYKIKVAGQQIDLDSAIQTAIKTAVAWGIHEAEKNSDWAGSDKKKFVENLAIHYLENGPLPVKNAEQYRPLISAAIEAMLDGAKLAKGQAVGATDDGMPKPAEPESNLQPTENDSQASQPVISSLAATKTGDK